MSGTGRGVVLASRYYHCREFQTPEALQQLRPVLRSKYFAADKSGIAVHRGTPGALTIAVHVRRGDVTANDPKYRHYYTPHEPILNTIRSVRAVANALGREVQIDVYSEGPRETFAALAAVLHEPYVGGTGVPLYKRAPGWIARDPAGAFDDAKLCRIVQPGARRPLRRLWRWLKRA